MSPISLTDAVTIVSAVSGSAAVATAVGYFTTRRKANADGELAELTVKSQAGISGMQELEMKLKYLNQVISALETHGVRLQAEVDREFERNTRLADRNAVLINRVDQLESLVRKICLEMNIDSSRYLS